MPANVEVDLGKCHRIHHDDDLTGWGYKERASMYPKLGPPTQHVFEEEPYQTSQYAQRIERQTSRHLLL